MSDAELRSPQLRQALADFTDWLHELDADEQPLPAPAETPSTVPDLSDFFGELAAMRRDLQQQAKTNEKLRRELSQLIEQAGGAATATADLSVARREGRAEAAAAVIEVVEAVERLAAQAPPQLPTFISGTRRQRLLQERKASLQAVMAKAETVMTRLNLTVVAAVGSAFDPTVMHATGSASGPGAAGTVASISQQGYRLHDQLIRPARVEVVT